MTTSRAHLDDEAGDSITKASSENEGKLTLPNRVSNPSEGGMLNCPVMWAEPKPLGLGTRSGGLEESLKARTVTKGEAARQTRPAGAVLAVSEPEGQAMPAPINSATPTQSAIDEKLGDGPDPWAKERKNNADEGYETLPLRSAFEHEAEMLGREQAFAIVKTARAMLKEEAEARRCRRDTPASPQTLADYAKKCGQIDREINYLEPGGPNPLLQVLSRHAARKQTFSVIKTALKWRGLERLRTLLQSQDLLQREQPDSHSWLAKVIDLKHSVTELKAVQSLNRQDSMDLAGVSAKPSRSKKFLLPRLPDAWQERFLDANLSSAKYRMAGVLLRHCGMRPKELALGVTLTATENGVAVRVTGAKVRDTAGQPWRTFTLRGEHLPEWFMREIAEKSKLVVRVDDDALRAHLSRLSDRVFNADGKVASRLGKNRLILSAYVFRHALVTDMREDGWETQNIAAVIGESSAATVRLYGIRLRTRSKSLKVVAIDPKSVETARPVRAVDSSRLSGLMKHHEKLRCRGSTSSAN